MELLQKWINTITVNGIIQRTPKWYHERELTIGGSSIGTIMGLNRFSCIKTFILERIKNIEHNKLCMNWGTLFEDIIRSYTEQRYNCEIVGDDMFIKYNEYLSYSPDGLSVIDNEIVLFEFKCPFSRKHSMNICKNYEAQIQMGLNVIDITSYGLLVQGWFMKSPNIVNGYYWQGIIGFHTTENVNEDLINFANVTEQSLNTIINRVINKEINMWWKNDGTLDDFLEHCKTQNSYPIGYLYWYLKYVNVDKINKVPNFLNDVQYTVKKIIETIKVGKCIDSNLVDSFVDTQLNDIYFEVVC